MKNKFFKIPVSDASEPETNLNNFCSTHSISHIEKHFVADGENSFWAIAITYTEPDQAVATKDKARKRIDYKEVLSPEDFNTYAKLREVRVKIAEEEGIPTYAVFNNEQLSQIVIQKVTTKTALQKIEGIDKGRVDKYGDTFIQAMSRSDND